MTTKSHNREPVHENRKRNSHTLRTQVSVKTHLTLTFRNPTFSKTTMDGQSVTVTDFTREVRRVRFQSKSQTRHDLVLLSWTVIRSQFFAAQSNSTSTPNFSPSRRPIIIHILEVILFHRGSHPHHPVPSHKFVRVPVSVVPPPHLNKCANSNTTQVVLAERVLATMETEEICHHETDESEKRKWRDLCDCMEFVGHRSENDSGMVELLWKFTGDGQRVRQRDHETGRQLPGEKEYRERSGDLELDSRVCLWATAPSAKRCQNVFTACGSNVVSSSGRKVVKTESPTRASKHLVSRQVKQPRIFFKQHVITATTWANLRFLQNMISQLLDHFALPKRRPSVSTSFSHTIHIAIREPLYYQCGNPFATSSLNSTLKFRCLSGSESRSSGGFAERTLLPQIHSHRSTEREPFLRDGQTGPEGLETGRKGET